MVYRGILTVQYVHVNRKITVILFIQRNAVIDFSHNVGKCHILQLALIIFRKFFDHGAVLGIIIFIEFLIIVPDERQVSVVIHTEVFRDYGYLKVVNKFRQAHAPDLILHSKAVP